MAELVFKLARYGRRLGTRGEGALAGEELWQALSAFPPGGKLIVDLAGLEVLSGSFADEAIALVADRLRDGALPERYLLVQAEDGELLEDLSERLSRRGLAMLALVGNDVQVLGKLPTYLGETLSQVIKNGALTSSDLAQSLGISIQNAAVRLKELARLRLIRLVPETRPMGGIQYRALSLVPLKKTP